MVVGFFVLWEVVTFTSTQVFCFFLNRGEAPSSVGFGRNIQPGCLESLMDSLTPEQRSRQMARIRGRDTKPELVVRKLLHARGYRYRLHDKRLPGTPDLIFPGRNKVVFVHGCFWHMHADCGRMPKSRLDFWRPKLEGNRARDTAKQEQLKGMGWDVLVVWECELRDLDRLVTKLIEFLGKNKGTR
jgi:DNA mismatch endonuclease (patch repair protein)